MFKTLINTLFIVLFTQSAIFANETTKINIDKSYFFSSDELKELQVQNPLNSYLSEKLALLLNTSIVAETDFAATDKITLDPRSQRLFFRTTHWNMERGYKLNELDQALNNTEDYLKENNQNSEAQNTKNIKEDLFYAEVKMMQESHIYTLNEADWGMARTDYQNTVERFANITKSKYYAFVPEFVEIDTKYLDQENLDKTAFKALHGNAIVSKFPIINTQVIALPDCYDWYLGEQEKISKLEKLKRNGSNYFFKLPIITELRRGQRSALLARIDIPDSDQDVTVVVAHFENRCLPKCRKKQMLHLLEQIKDIDTPLILSGDFNNAEVSSEPTSVNSVVTRTVTDWQNLARATVTWFNPISYIINPAFLVFNTARKTHDPTVFGLPIFLRNKSADLFWLLINFEFIDQNMFDFSDAKELCYKGQDGKLANSNQRVTKGFASTFKLLKHNLLTHFRFDWIFVKSMRIAGCQDNEDDFEDIKPECKNFIPAFARNLSELNESKNKVYPKEVIKAKDRDFVLDRLSDHDPITCKILL